MTRRGRPTFLLVTATLAALLSYFHLQPRSARADEDDDIQRQIETQKAGVTDLDHLDSRRGATAELQRLREWLALAWELRAKHDPDAAREVLDRCLAQAELVRQVIAATNAKAEVAAREAKLKKTKDDIEQKKQALHEAEVKKKALLQVMGS